MSVLLNVFQLAEKIVILTLIAGLISIFAGIINIKDCFAFQKGISLTLSGRPYPSFYQNSDRYKKYGRVDIV